MNGNVFVICAPSGAGKTSLARALLTHDPHVHLSVSHTTRPARPGEENGRHYLFVSRDAFQRMLENGEFLESAEVHGHLYGTSQKWIEQQRAEGHDILLEIDWQGARQVRRLLPDTVGIFVLPPSLEALRGRLTERRQDSKAVIERRLAAARSEISHVEEFDYVIINRHFDDAVEDLASIVRAARLRLAIQVSRNSALINSLK
ncbi:MAG TPA: guanylate kinase [Burkholderiales bacterium]|nr:guanylate kinase [Burkholderiales bacterium]